MILNVLLGRPLGQRILNVLLKWPLDQSVPSADAQSAEVQDQSELMSFMVLQPCQAVGRGVWTPLRSPDST